jgi:hypothetical protein
MVDKLLPCYQPTVDKELWYERYPDNVQL